MKYVTVLLVVFIFSITSFGQNNDTTKVLMQVSDTSHGNYTAMTSRVWWMKGYVMYGRKEPIYLDEQKQPLPKGFVVWITKELKP